MAGNAQLDRLAQIVKTLEQGLAGSVSALQKNIAALTSSASGGVPPKARKELVKALGHLRSALNRAILSLERRISGRPAPRAKKAARKKK